MTPRPNRAWLVALCAAVGCTALAVAVTLSGIRTAAAEPGGPRAQLAGRGDGAAARAWFQSAVDDPDAEVAAAARAGLEKLAPRR